MEINVYMNKSRKFGQELTNVYYRPQTRLNLSQLKRKAESTNTSMRHKSQRDIDVSIKKRTNSSHNQTIQTVRFCDVKQFFIDEQNKQLIEDIDMKYYTQPQYCSLYNYEIQEYLKQIQQNKQVQDYFTIQPQITMPMRSILIEWIIDVSNKFRLKQETLYLTIDIIDRYALTTPISKNILQLVGVSSMLIASKMEEIHQLFSKDLSFITDRTFTKDQIIYTESLILRQLNFNLTYPTAIQFLNRYQIICPLNLRHFYYCQLIIETYLILQPQAFKSSELAAGAFLVMRKLKKYNPLWPEELQIVSNCDIKKLNLIVKILQHCQIELQSRQQIFNSIYNKFSQYKYCRIINI